MIRDVSAHAVSDFVARELGCRPTHVARREAFVTNAVFDVRARGERFIVKASRLHGALRAEAWACAQSAAAGCEAPQILAFGRIEAADPLSAFVMRRLAGEPIAACDATWPEVGAHLRRLHEVKVAGFGTLADAAEDGRGGYRPAHASWSACLESICADTRRLEHGSARAQQVAESLTTALDDHRAELAAIVDGSLCHGDLKPAHILVDDGRLSGVIDWGDAVLADPLWDIARFAHRVDPGLTAALVAGYDPDGALADALAWRLPLYGALWMLVDAIVDDRLGRDVGGLLEGSMHSLHLLTRNRH
jgi:aminoglycoside phosphotransferase (APT) family kinase protein